MLITICFLIIWLVVSTPLKNMKVRWDHEIPNIWKVIKAMFQTTNQLCFLFCLAIELPLNSRFRKRAPTVPQFQVSLRSSRSKSTRPPWSSPRTKACATVGINKTWWNWYNMFIFNLNGYILTLWNAMINTNAYVIFINILYLYG